MEISIKSLILFGSLMFTGLSAGLFYSWSVSVIPGIGKVSDVTYLQAMQSINRAILNPAFFIVFFGSAVCLGLASIYEFYTNSTAFWILLISTLTYLIGTIGVTGLGNVPLNDQLEMLNLNDLSPLQAAEFRNFYEINWNRLHLIRMTFAVVSFSGAIWAFFFQGN